MTLNEDVLVNGVRAHKIAKNFGFLTMGKLLGDLSTFLFFVVLSRAYGQEGIGQYSLAMALTGFFVLSISSSKGSLIHIGLSSNQ